MQCFHLFNVVNSASKICEHSRFHSLLIFTIASVHDKCRQFKHRTERFLNCSLNYIPNWSRFQLPKTSRTHVSSIEMATKRSRKMCETKSKTFKNVEAMAFNSCAIDWLRDVHFCFVCDIMSPANRVFKATNYIYFYVETERKSNK